ncbi:hypothetical protein AZE42_03210 [Rhizopogon vesiculosus]|jgi:hypothetical protein|uniref:Uncharacterized protein n=1 Tax=Rhizopogon vesiculosus TaxID=180088 RepID=A0A1J8QCX8_9AGAM|nr:hypothetical protein AZE42_03210 [Rhizopogon vesiculosus]
MLFDVAISGVLQLFWEALQNSERPYSSMDGKSTFLVPPNQITPLKLQQTEWRKVDALNSATYADILPG